MYYGSLVGRLRLPLLPASGGRTIQPLLRRVPIGRGCPVLAREPRRASAAAAARREHSRQEQVEEYVRTYSFVPAVDTYVHPRRPIYTAVDHVKFL